ncbi:MAG: hypothetical protein II589_06465, partial [Clostridia bacterium]|nr:hypothetical protein [Clostridia bacterium]
LRGSKGQRVSPAGSVGASASQSSPPENRTPLAAGGTLQPFARGEFQHRPTDCVERGDALAESVPLYNKFTNSLFTCSKTLNGIIVLFSSENLIAKINDDIHIINVYNSNTIRHNIDDIYNVNIKVLYKNFNTIQTRHKNDEKQYIKV